MGGHGTAEATAVRIEYHRPPGNNCAMAMALVIYELVLLITGTWSYYDDY